MPLISHQSAFEQHALSFQCDGLRIAGVLHRPPAGKPPVVIGSHGLFSNGDSPKQMALAEALNASGIAFLRLDHRGCGQSEGQFDVVTTFEGRVRDLIAATRVLEEQLEAPFALGLFGSSLGGATCLAAAPVLSPVRMVTLAAPVESRSLRSAAQRDPSAARPAIFEAEHFQFDLTDKLSGIRDLLIVHGEADEVVPLAHARQIFAAVGEPKELIINPDGDHRVTDPEHQRNLIAGCRRWFLNLLAI
jgi:alpha-beta hydrolase superfamily lysophospholipase